MQTSLKPNSVAQVFNDQKHLLPSDARDAGTIFTIYAFLPLNFRFPL